MDEYKGNSHRDRQKERTETTPERRVEKVVTGVTTVRKKNTISKLSEVFFAKDIQSVKDYMIHEMFIPWLRRSTWDFLTNGLHMTLFGEPDKDSRSQSRASRVSYWRGPNNRNDDRDDNRYRRERRDISGYSYDSILFETRGDAELALDKMDEIMERYHLVRVADLFDLADQTCESTDYAYGWTDLTSARAVQTRDGRYILKLPRAMPLD